MWIKDEAPIMHLAKIRVKQIATEAINKAITAQVADGKTNEGLIDWKTDTAGKVSGFMLNYNEHMRITASTMNIVQSTLQNVHMLKEKSRWGRRWAVRCWLHLARVYRFVLSPKALSKWT